MLAALLDVLLIAKIGAVVAAATHAPITAIIIIFELTGDYHIIPPLMAACVVSTLVATRLRRDSIYTLKLRLRGLDLVVRGDHSEFFVVDEEGSYLGGVSLTKLRTLIFQHDTLQHVLVARDVLEESVPRVTEDDDLDVVMRAFGDSQLQELPVVDAKRTNRIVGSVHRHDVINARNQEHMRRDLAGSLSSTISLVGEVRKVDIGDGYVIREITAPFSFCDRTLKDLAIGSYHNVQVIFLRRRKSEIQDTRLVMPRADTKVGEGDTLIVAGTEMAVDALAAL